MPLANGARLGPYEIQSALGAGGMGEVYKARDTRLDRSVAIKVLPAHVASDPDLRQRLEREARAVAALNHPHICTLHDIGSQAGTDFLVMEYLDGETLATRLEKGPLPLDHALQYAIQIADALDKAHRHGITHRDLKPGNVMLTKAGTKLLDFGLARIRSSGPDRSRRTDGSGGKDGVGLSAMPTEAALTAQGMILGTLQYMAPEQLEGRDADARTDIFAFGALVYEMVTARKAFEGKSQASLISSIMSSHPPPISTLQPLTPVALDRLVRTCLAKDPDQRWQSAGDLTRELKWIAEAGSRVDASGPVVAPRRRLLSSVRLAWSVAAVALVGVVALAIPAVRRARESAPELLQTRFEIQTPPTSDPGSFALSSDGRQLAFVAMAEGAPRLWVRSLDQVMARLLPGTDGAAYPFWAPDGHAIGFFATGKLKRVDLSGGAPQTLAEAPLGRGGAWNREGVIVFAPSGVLAIPTSVLMRVAATGGVPTPVTHLAADQSTHRWPQFLPDGRRFLFFVSSRRPDTQGAYLGSLDGGEPTRVLASDTGVLFAPPNLLLLVRQDVLVAQRFDPVRGTVSGDPVPVAQAVGVDNGVFRGGFSVSSSGVVAHRAGSGSQRRQLQWVNRSGTLLGTVGSPDENGLASPDLAPDGRRVAVFRGGAGAAAVWLIDVGRGVPSRFTFDASVDGYPVWSPDGHRVAFTSSRNLFEKPSNGVGDEQPLLVTAEPKAPLSWSPDGQFLLYASQDPKTGADLWVLPLVGDRKPFPVVRTPFEEGAGQFSPDRRWVVYQANATGRMEIYVRPFPGPGGQWQVTTAGGSQPRWRPDGKELFFIAPDARLMAVPIAVGADRQTLEPGAPVTLFPSRLASGANILTFGALSRPQYAVAPDGRFLMNVAIEEATASPITVVLNWDAGIKK